MWPAVGRAAPAAPDLDPHDGRSIYLIADGVDVLVIDANTYEVTDTVEPLTFVDRINALAVGPGALWVATGSAGILQRFDLPS